MFSLVEALRYRCLRYIRQPLRHFHVLVGPNASGKTTFLDVIGFLSQLVSEGLDSAIESRTTNFQDLLWNHQGSGFEMALEARIPETQRELLAVKKYDTVRYEVGIGRDLNSGEIVIFAERGWLLQSNGESIQSRLAFPDPEPPPSQIITVKKGKLQSRSLFTKTPGGNDNYYADARDIEGRWAPAFKLGPRKSTLGNLPEDESNFPVSTWFKQLLSNGVERIVLNSQQIRLSSPPGQGSGFKPDGSNLPWVLSSLEAKAPERITAWLSHLRMALPDLSRVYTRQREDDRHRYLVLVYQDGLEVPSWMASDGTLRLLTLTLPAYLDELKGIYLIEEPENGIHPRAVETMFQSLSSVYKSQILLASHSPVVLSSARAADILCFAKNSEGATDIVTGDKHPKLRDWHGEVNLGTLFAAGVLG
jgi:predicted ATPase